MQKKNNEAYVTSQYVGSSSKSDLHISNESCLWDLVYNSCISIGLIGRLLFILLENLLILHTCKLLVYYESFSHRLKILNINFDFRYPWCQRCRRQSITFFLSVPAGLQIQFWSNNGCQKQRPENWWCFWVSFTQSLV